MKLFSTLIVAGSALAIAGAAQAAENYQFSGGPAGGGWHPAISAGTQLLNDKLGSKYKFEYKPSLGSVENVRRIALGDTDTTWGHVVQIYQAWNGTGLFEKDGKSEEFRIIANVRKQTQIIAVLADSPIKSYSDMKGKKVNLLSKGTGSNVNCVNIFKGIGIFDEIDPRYLGFSDSARALGDRQIDVYCSAGAPYTIPALTELSINKPVRYISMTDEEQAAVVKTLPFYVPATIPVQPDVKGMDAPAKSIAYDVFWMVSSNVSDDAVSDMLATVNNPEALKQLAATAGYWKTLNGDFSALEVLKLPLHPSAAKYWKENGGVVPDSVVKGF
jgi:TRAP transporter TAXI family solute receptor